MSPAPIAAADLPVESTESTESTTAGVPAAAGAEVAPQRGSATRNRMTGRAAVLLLVVGMLGVAYAWPVREYIRQRGELTALKTATGKVQAKVDALEAAKARWADPAYVEAQARGRLHYVMPGEVAFTVVHPGQSTLVKTLPKTPPRPQACSFSPPRNSTASIRCSSRTRVAPPANRRARCTCTAGSS